MYLNRHAYGAVLQGNIWFLHLLYPSKFKSVTREVVDRQTSEIAGLTDAAQRGESAQRSMEAQQRVLCEAEGRTGRIYHFHIFKDVNF